MKRAESPRADRFGHALIDADLDEFRVSLDAATVTTFTRIRGVDAFDTVIQNLRRFTRLLHAAERPKLSLWLTATCENLNELPDLVTLAAEIGVPEVYVQRLVLIHRGLAQTEHSLYRQLRAQEGMALTEAAERARACGIDFRASRLVSLQESLRRQDDGDRPWSACYRLWMTTYVTANGNVLPCCISPFSTADYADLVLGNIFQTPFAHIWNGAKYVERRVALYTARPLEPCEQCGVNWSL